MTRAANDNQRELAQCAADPAGLAMRLAAAPMKPRKPQNPCDFGLFGDTAAQIDLLDMVKRDV